MGINCSCCCYFSGVTGSKDHHHSNAIVEDYPLIGKDHRFYTPEVASLNTLRGMSGIYFKNYEMPVRIRQNAVAVCAYISTVLFLKCAAGIWLEFHWNLCEMLMLYILAWILAPGLQSSLSYLHFSLQYKQDFIYKIYHATKSMG